jgi:hypothetical protein
MFRLRSMLPLAALGLAAMLGGCVAYPAYSGYPAYGYGYGTAVPAYYAGGYYGYYGGAYYGGGHPGEWHNGWRR